MSNTVRSFTGEQLDRVAFPLGGIGAGMLCIEGAGALSHVSLRNRPDVFNEPTVFSTLHIRGAAAKTRVLEGPVPNWKIAFPWGAGSSGNGGGGKSYGLPRFSKAEFSSKFPFAHLDLTDDSIPVSVHLAAWSPFTPGDADGSSFPVAGLEYSFTNTSNEKTEVVYSFHAANFMATAAAGNSRTRSVPGGFMLINPGSEEKPHDEGYFCAVVDDPATKSNSAWFRGGWYDSLSRLWQSVEGGETPDAAPPDARDPSPGASLSLAFSLKPGESRTVRLRLSWYVPLTDLSTGTDNDACCESDSGGACGCGSNKPEYHKPWYSGKYMGIDEIDSMWKSKYDTLRESSQRFTNCFYRSTLPPEIVEAVAANLSILKSPTVLRQLDGRMWAFEGCGDSDGCCAGSCTHVWNYAQAIPHLFPELERGLRLTEFTESQSDEGHQNFRAFLPIRQADHIFHAAADGQLGGIMKIHREWRISGDREWLRMLMPRIRRSLDYCIATWDPDRIGALVEPHHNTYDIEFWGADGMCTSIYLGALRAVVLMGNALGEDIAEYDDLYQVGRAYMEKELFNGEYFIQRVQWEGLRAGPVEEGVSVDQTNYSPEALELLKSEGPKYQYGEGCLSDGIIGAWLAEVCGIGEILNSEMVKSHLLAVYEYNFKTDLIEHANPQRPGFALGNEGGLLLCTWPKGGEPGLPFVYSKEVWTGIEYQVASHLMMVGHLREGLDIVRACRARYDGVVRNPYDEIECGHWYARALASYALLQGAAGVFYDKIEKVLILHPQVDGDFEAFFAADGGYGTAGVKDGEPFAEVVSGDIEISRIEYTAR